MFVSPERRAAARAALALSDEALLAQCDEEFFRLANVPKLQQHKDGPKRVVIVKQMVSKECHMEVVSAILHQKSSRFPPRLTRVLKRT